MVIGDSVLVSWSLSVTSWYRLEPRWDENFWFSLYDSL